MKKKKIVIICEMETRSRRAQFLFEPSEYEEWKKLWKKRGMSANERMNQLIKADLEQNRREKI